MQQALNQKLTVTVRVPRAVLGAIAAAAQNRTIREGRPISVSKVAGEALERAFGDDNG